MYMHSTGQPLHTDDAYFFRAESGGKGDVFASTTIRFSCET
jgi:hypothetical protein